MDHGCPICRAAACVHVDPATGFLRPEYHEDVARLARLEAAAEAEFAGLLRDDVILELSAIFGFPPPRLDRRRN